MERDWGYFRRLYEGLFDADDHAGVRRYLQGQLQTATDHLSELGPLRTRERIPPGGHIGNGEHSLRIMKLYALSRVSDWLIESIYQAGSAATVFGGTDHPWIHEQRDFRGSESEALTLYLEFLCGLTHRRQLRPTTDLAVGWGSNSQWATSFRRFYADQEGLHFNWDGPVDIGDDPPLQRPGVPPNEDPLDQRREVLVHRCFVTHRPLQDEFDRFP